MYVGYITEHQNAQSKCWQICILYNDKNDRGIFLIHSNDNGIMTRPTWRLMNELEMFKDCEAANLSNAKILRDRIVNVPSNVTQ